MNLMRFEKLVDDLARLDGTGKYATASNIVAGDAYFAQALEAEYGQSIADLRKLVADEQKSIDEDKSPASTRPQYLLIIDRGVEYLLSEDGILEKRLRCELAFRLVDVFRDQLGFLFDEDELRGTTMKNLESYTPQYAAHVSRSLELAKQLGFATPPQSAPLSAAELRELAQRLSAPAGDPDSERRIDELVRRVGGQVYRDSRTAGRPPLAAVLATLAASALEKVPADAK